MGMLRLISHSLSYVLCPLTRWLSQLKFCFCANKDNWMCPGIFCEFELSSVDINNISISSSSCRLWIWDKETVLQSVGPYWQHYKCTDKYIAHQICGAGVWHPSLYEERASVGCQMMSLLIFYRLTQLFRDTQFKYLRWRRFKYQKQTRPC